ncbi:ribokinase [Leifsonia sp. NPDC058248]|uniref:ribokinase n=1 Tax=Leifsonia sp. NPDC058248 TaxID=3346402 RepID=UPI0036D82743
MSAAAARVLVVGSLNLDSVYRLTAAPRAGETVTALESDFAVGGKGGNQAIAAARAGAAVSMVGALGDDDAGQTIADSLDRAGVDTRHLSRIAGRPSGSAVVLVDRTGENRIVLSPGANGHLAQATVSAGLSECRPGDIVVLQNEIPPVLSVSAARAAHDRGLRVIWNAAPAPVAAEQIPPADIIVVNEEELRALASLHGLHAGAGLQTEVDRLADATGVAVVCTAGAHGVYFRTRAESGHVAAPRVDAVDTTAAGDTFVGYLAAALVHGERRFTDACHHAASAASLAVTRRGASPSIPTRSEVHEFERTIDQE